MENDRPHEMAKDRAVLVYSTFPTTTAAEEVGRALVEASLVACVNIIPGIVSIYEWEGKVQCEAEAAMVMKTTARLSVQAVDEVRRRHTYDNPAVVVLPIEGGSAPFLDWIAAQTANCRMAGR